MRVEQVLKDLDELAAYIAHLRKCVVENHANLESKIVTAAKMSWERLHAEDGPVDEKTVD